MTLSGFSVSGDPVVDEAGTPDEYGDLPLLSEADRERKILRYDEAGQSLSLAVRLNRRLLEAAKEHPLIVFRLSPGDEVEDGAAPEVSGRGRARDWISDGLHLYWRIFEKLETEDFRSCYLASAFAESLRRTHYFVSEQPERLIRIVSSAAAKKGFSLEHEQTSLGRVAADFLPIELVGQLGLHSAGGRQSVKAGFGFWGAEDNLLRLRRDLEGDGFVLDEFIPSLRELRMAKEVPVEPSAFLRILQRIVPLSRSLGCSYRGEETADGHEQFLLTSPKPGKYYPAPTSLTRRLFGRRGAGS